MRITVLLFDDFETLDVFGPVEIFGRLKDLFRIRFASLDGVMIRNYHGVSHPTVPLAELEKDTDIFLIPGGYGTRTLVDEGPWIDAIRATAEHASYVLTVCTGTALLARTGLLDGREATSNKKAFQWVVGNGPEVRWNKRARWVVDGKYFTSSGVTAGMDMSLGFIEIIHGSALAEQVAKDIEYCWIRDKDNDSFVALAD
jgi:putative intracellular protease/amidase